MSDNPLVTIALHIGLEKNILLLENLLKSFLACNEYDNIEILLIESGGSQTVRVWLESLDFDSNFVKFNGVKTRFKKKPGTIIQKELLFMDFDPHKVKGTVCAEISHHTAIKKARGDYFVFLPEDNQFTIMGNTIQDLINILKNYGENKTNVYMLTQQLYKYGKQNNKFNGPLQTSHGTWVCIPHHMKWDPFCFAKKSIYKDTGGIPPSNGIPHHPVKEYSKILSDLGFKRVYPVVPMGIQMYNDHRPSIIDLLQKNDHDPNFFAYALMSKDSIEKLVENGIKNRELGCPLATDNFPRNTIRN